MIVGNKVEPTGYLSYYDKGSISKVFAIQSCYQIYWRSRDRKADNMGLELRIMHSSYTSTQK